MMKVLDKGFIEVIDTLGNDLTVVNSARVSFGNRKETWDKSDERLVRYLAKNKHFSPFRHMQVQFHIKAPEMVMRQAYKHVVGIETTSNSATKDHAWNEISGRYTEIDDYYIPEVWRAQSTDNKQASDGELDDLQQKRMSNLYGDLLRKVEQVYDSMLQSGVAREQARIIMPLSQYTEVYWTASFQAIMNFIELRDHDHAQWEIREYAKVMKDLMMDIYPETMKIWSEVYWNET
ncbi:FAD-dependent thymidylate synthase [bacterium]|nr:FAD-dependent thymidylate synthase [bacterium]